MDVCHLVDDLWPPQVCRVTCPRHITCLLSHLCTCMDVCHLVADLWPPQVCHVTCPRHITCVLSHLCTCMDMCQCQMVHLAPPHKVCLRTENLTDLGQLDDKR